MNGFDNMEMEEASGPSLFTPEKIIGMVRRHYILMMVVCIGVFLSALVVAYSLPEKYTATTRVFIDSREKNIVDMVNVLSGIENNTPTIESEVEIIKSRAVAVDVIRHMDLANDPEYSGKAGFISIAKRKIKNRLMRLLGRKPTGSHGGGEGVRGDLIDAYFAGLGARRVRNTYLIEISFEAGSAKKASGIANSIADFYLRHQLNAKVRAAVLATNWLEQRIDVLRKKVVFGERQIEAFKLEHQMIHTEGHLLNEKQMARAMEQTVMARSKTYEARSKYLQIKRLMDQNGSNATVADVLKSPTIAMLKDQLAKITRKKAELSTRYGALHPDMKKIAAELSDIRRQLRAEVGRIVANLKNELDEATSLESGLTSNLGGLQAKSAVSRKASVKLREMEREVKASRLVYEKFLERYKQTAEQEKMQLPDARIVESALQPSHPSSPKRARIIAMGLAGGFGLSFLLAFGIEFVRGGIRDPDDLKLILGIKNVTPLPLIEIGDGKIGDGKIGNGDGDTTLRLLRHVVNAPASIYSDAIRELRFSLDAGNVAAGSRVILVASALSGEGKSMVASNLAHHFSAVGMKTVLVDGDLREMTLTRTLLPNVQYGLYECLRDDQGIDAAVVMDRVSGLYFLPAKSPVPLNVSAVDVLGSGRMLTALDDLRDNFDVIILDCPPVTPVIDAQILAEQADQLVFVCQWGATKTGVAVKAFERLNARNGRFSVAAFNQMDGAEFNSRYGYGQGQVTFIGADVEEVAMLSSN